MGALFGTDGIRGKAGVYPLDDDTLIRLGSVLGTGARSVFICWDTRQSSTSIYAALAAGIQQAGGHVIPGGVLPTPAAAVLAQKHSFGAAVSISASHNPYEDNGIKIFGAGGKKLPDEEELAIESAIAQSPSHAVPMATTAGASTAAYINDYVAALKRHADFKRIPRIAIDCANGASAKAAQKLFAPLDAMIINDSPDGRNINDQCGSLHPASLQNIVRETGAEIGVALDGDGDRAIFVDETGQVRDGDYTLYILARAMSSSGNLPGNLVVSTVMANMGLDVALREAGITLIKTTVGDRYVLAEMEKRGATLGGEQSGHTILLDMQPAGDGLLTTIVVLNILTAADRPFSQLCAPMRKFPQVLLNVPVREKKVFDEIPEIHQKAGMIEKELQGRGRLVLRYSGTEMMARIMIEGENHGEIEGMAAGLAALIGEQLGK